MLLQLVVPDLHIDREGLEGAATEGLPRLPALEALLRFGGAEPAPQSSHVLLAGLAGRADLGAHPPAQVVAAAQGLPNPASAWFATPVHRIAGLDHLRLHPAGILRLDARQQRALAGDFERTFGGDGLALQPAGQGFLLTGLPDVDAQALEPWRLLGADLKRAPPTGPGAARLRRLGAEIEMWLHGRTASEPTRLLPPNGLWLWGGGLPAATAPAVSATGGLPWLFADEPQAAALWTLAGGAARPLPATYKALRESGAGGDGQPVVACVEAVPRAPGDRTMQRLEADWFAPALAAFRSGEVSSLRLHAAGRAWRLRRPFGWQRWRRPRPWWESLAT